MLGQVGEGKETPCLIHEGKEKMFDVQGISRPITRY